MASTKQGEQAFFPCRVPWASIDSRLAREQKKKDDANTWSGNEVDLPPFSHPRLAVDALAASSVKSNVQSLPSQHKTIVAHEKEV